MYRRWIRSEGVHEKEWGGSPGSGPTPVESKGMEDILHNQSEPMAEGRRGSAFLDRPDCIYAGGGGWGIKRDWDADRCRRSSGWPPQQRAKDTEPEATD